VPGDVLEVREPLLFRNGKPITGAEAFNLNATRTGLYRGYVNASPLNGGNYLAKGDTVPVPAKGYFAMGDNSRDSQDSRYWGFVPDKDVVGRPIFIYYPFTKRWGPAR
jgi:signal peptidase I